VPAIWLYSPGPRRAHRAAHSIEETDMTDPTFRLALLDTLFEAFNAHDVEGVLACFDDDVVFETAVGPEPYGARITGKAATGAAFTAVWTGMPDVRWTVVRHSIDGDHALTEWLFTGTKDGVAVEREGLDLFRFSGDRIVSKRAFRKSAAA
jgi:ketosteroid isomerase-like protein